MNLQYQVLFTTINETKKEIKMIAGACFDLGPSAVGTAIENMIILSVTFLKEGVGAWERRPRSKST